MLLQAQVWQEVSQALAPFTASKLCVVFDQGRSHSAPKQHSKGSCAKGDASHHAGVDASQLQQVSV